MVVQVRDRKTRLMEVDHEESIGIAKSEASGRVKGVRSAVRDMACLEIVRLVRSFRNIKNWGRK